MKAILTITFLLVFSINSICQEVILTTNFAVRDFKIKNNTLVYIEKRDIKSFNLLSKKPDTLFKDNIFFIGGYGLNIFYANKSNEIITSSNELIRNISSIRFYDIEKKEVNKYEVYYTTELMDFLLDEEQTRIFLSKKNLCIDIISYGGNLRYKKTDSIKSDSFSRKLKLYDDKLYYITDKGNVFEYNIEKRKNKLLTSTKTLLVNFKFDKEYKHIYLTTINGKLLEINIKNGKITKELNVGKEIVEAIDIIDNKYLIVGDWDGVISIINKEDFKITKQFNNKKRIIKIVSSGKDTFYTSSSDKTIKKWKIK